MSTQIELAVGQTWMDDDGEKRTIKAIDGEYVYYLKEIKSGDLPLGCKIERFQEAYSTGLLRIIPKTVRKSQCVALFKDHAIPIDGFVGLFATKEEATEYCETFDYAFKMWPLVVNGVEQWVEVPKDE